MAREKWRNANEECFSIKRHFYESIGTGHTRLQKKSGILGLYRLIWRARPAPTLPNQYFEYAKKPFNGSDYCAGGGAGFPPLGGSDQYECKSR